jgi:hypothetical protein
MEWFKSSWTKETLRQKLFELIEEGKPINTMNVKHIKGFYSSAQRIHGSYPDFLRDNGLNPYEYLHQGNRLDEIRSQCGLLFEHILGDIFRDLGVSFTKYKSGIDSIHPDFMLTGEKWVDAKLHSNADIQDTIKRYEKHCSKLIIVYLIGDKAQDRMITEKTRLVSVSYFLNMLKEDKRNEYLLKLKSIESIAGYASAERKAVAK